LDPTKILEKILDPHTGLHDSILNPSVIDTNNIIAIDQENTSGRQLLQGCRNLMAKPFNKKLILGETVHKLIHDDFFNRVDGALVYNFMVPGASAAPLRTQRLCGEDSTVIDPQIIGGQAGRGFLDLARISADGDLEIAEIKPASWGCFLDGDFQLKIYINQANADDPLQQAWRSSMGIKEAKPMPTNTFPARNYLIGNVKIETAWCSPGILVYRVEKSKKERDPKPVPYIEKKRARDELKRDIEKKIQEKGDEIPAALAAASNIAESTAANLAAQARIATWEHFWLAVVATFGLAASIAAFLATVDGPLPFGKLLAIGITVPIIIAIFARWDELWEKGEKIARGEII